MPVVGRILNMTSEILAVGKRNLTDTFFISPQPDNNYCLTGNCMQYCSINHPTCGEKDMLEVDIDKVLHLKLILPVSKMPFSSLVCIYCLLAILFLFIRI